MTGTGTEGAISAEGELRKCRAVKQGRINLLCTEPEGHDRQAEGEPTWHRALYTSSQQVRYDGARHTIEQTEIVEWEPVDHIAEAGRHLTAARREP